MIAKIIEYDPVTRMLAMWCVRIGYTIMIGGGIMAFAWLVQGFYKEITK